jgi:DnaJ like chaperone protein
MQWFGKGIGGLIGAFVGGPVGSLLGVIVGHRLDEIRRLFVDTTFEVMGYVAKADGRVSEDEVHVARRIMQAMRLSDEQVQDAIEHFTRGKRAGYPLEDRIEALADGGGGLARTFMQIQLQAALGAGAVGRDKRQALERVARALGLGRAELAQLEEIVRGMAAGGGAQAASAQSLEAAHRVLGVSPQASDEEVKTAYRRLMNQHHPDKLVARGLPVSMVGVAEQRTREVRAAYERIKTQRGFK